MLWFSVWFVLVVGTLVGAFVLGRRLWRSARGLLRELENASALLERLDALQEEAARRFPPPEPPRPAVEASPEDVFSFKVTRIQHREHVAARRSRRLRVAMAHWHRLGSPL